MSARPVLILVLLWLAVPRATGAKPPAETRFEFTEPHMGTKFRIVLYAPDEATAKKASRAAFDRIAVLDAMMSDYRADSELVKLCARAGGPPVKVSEELFFVLSKAQEVSRLSEGAFDVTVGPVVQLWRLSRRTQRLPEAPVLEKAKALVGWRNVLLDPKERTVKLLKPGMQLDLGGIAKGYAGDEAQKLLKAHGITRASRGRRRRHHRERAAAGQGGLGNRDSAAARG